MDDEAGALQASAHREEPRRHHHPTIFFKSFRPDDDVGDVSLVLQRHEDHAFRRTRPLPHQDETGDGDHRILPQAVAAQLRVAHDAARREPVAEETHRMLFQRQPGGHVIFHDVLAERHGRERDGRFREKLVAQVRRQ